MVRAEREQLVAAMRRLEMLGLNSGAAGNASVRDGIDGYWITPSGISPGAMTDSSIVQMSYAQEPIDETPQPSSEWRFHRDLYLARPDAQAIVHTHSSYATAFACLGRAIPAFHYMVAVAGGNSIRCAPYATFGTQALSDYAVAALQDRSACLLANHGVIALGDSVAGAVKLMIEVESLAKQYALASQLGEPTVLNEVQMRDVLEKFESYGQNNE